MHQRHRLYLKGKRKFVAEFDAVAFTRAQRKLKMLTNWLMDKSERYLAVFQRSNALCLTSDSSSTDSAYNKVPKLHSAQTDRQEHAAAVNKFFWGVHEAETHGQRHQAVARSLIEHGDRTLPNYQEVIEKYIKLKFNVIFFIMNISLLTFKVCWIIYPMKCVNLRLFRFYSYI